MIRNGTPTVSEAIVKRSVAAFDIVAILGAGVAAMHWAATAVDWHLAGLVVLLGTILGINFLHLVGAYRFTAFAHSTAPTRCSIRPASVALLCSAFTSFGKHEPP